MNINKSWNFIRYAKVVANDDAKSLVAETNLDEGRYIIMSVRYWESGKSNFSPNETGAVAARPTRNGRMLRIDESLHIDQTYWPHLCGFPDTRVCLCVQIELYDAFAPVTNILLMKSIAWLNGLMVHWEI